ncbi:hypothetical protein O5D80_005080 [Batrachochytrium dendrobatidis]|nr:hypothetical protein O5D80_005080 [Batrachochytrium dendrobatidis]
MHTVEQQRSCFGSPRVLLYPDFCDLNQLSPSASMDAFGIDSMEGPESGDDLDKPSHPSSVALMLKRFQPGHVQGVKGDPCSVWGSEATFSTHDQFKDLDGSTYTNMECRVWTICRLSMIGAALT